MRQTKKKNSHIKKKVTILFLSGNLLFLNGCSLIKDGPYQLQLEKYTDETFLIKVSPIMEETPFYENQPIEEKEEALMDLIYKNNMLTNHQKQIAVSMIPYFTSNPYTDYQHLYEQLNILCIYNTTFKDGKTKGLNVQSNFINTILLEENAADTTFRHEFIHATSHNLKQSAMEEALTTIIQEEYGTYEGAYQDIATAVRMLIELIGPEPFLMADATKDSSIIEQELYCILPNKQKVKQLLDSITKIDDAIQEEQYINKNIRKTYYDLIEEFYQTKYQESIYQNQNMCYYMSFLNEDYKEDKNGNYYLEYPVPYYFQKNRLPIIYGLYENSYQITAYLMETEQSEYQKKLIP